MDLESRMLPQDSMQAAKVEVPQDQSWTSAFCSWKGRNAAAFFILGLVNNFGYVVMLSAAE